MSLKPNTTYYYRVKAVSPTQESNYSNVIAVTTAPSNLQVTPIAASNPILYSNKVESEYIELYFIEPAINEYIEEIKLTVSTNNDYSAPLYNDLTYTIEKNTNWIYINNTKYLSVGISNLTPDTLYYIRARFSNEIGLSGYLTTSIRTNKIINPPTLLGVSNLTAIEATLEWTPVKAATSYILDVSTNSTFTSLVVNGLDVGNVTSRVVTALTENTTYYYRVRTVSVSTTSNNSQTLSFTTLDDVETYSGLGSNLNTPSILSIENVFIDTFNVRWLSVSSITNYTLELSTQNDFSSLVTTLNTTKTNHTFTGLTAGTAYYVRVKAVNDLTESNYSTFNITTLVENINLTAVQVLTPSTVFSSGVVLNWVKRTYANRYLIEISTDNFSNVLNSYFVGDISSFLIDGLTPSTEYQIRVYGLNSINTSSVSNIVSVTTEATLPTITVNAPTDIKASQVRLNWSVNAAYSKYLLSVYPKFIGSSIGQYIGNGYYNRLDVGYSGTHLIELFLNPNTTYSYQIIGVTEEGDEQYSAITEFTTRSTAPIVQINPNGTLLEWSNELNRLEVATDAQFKNCIAGWNPRTVTVTNKEFLISNLLESDTNYYIRGYRVLNDIEGEFSPVVNTFSKDITLLQPKVTKTTALIRWKQNDSSVYRIQLLVNNLGDFIPVSGFTFPLNVGNVNIYSVENLTADTEYQIKIQYYDDSIQKFSPLSLPLTFKTNKLDDIEELNLNSSLTDITLTTADVSFDRYTVNISGSYDYYVIETSRRADFLSIENYVETTSNSFTFIGLANTDYYVRAYGIDESVGEYTDVANTSVTTLNIPASPSPVADTPILNTVTVLNAAEVRLEWTDTSDEIGYVVELSQSPDFDLIEKDLTIIFPSSTSAVVSGLSGAITYYARVYAYNRISTSDYSNVLTVDTTP